MSEPDLNPQDQYWATLPNEDLIPCLVKRRKKFADMMINSGLLKRITRNWQYYHGLYFSYTGEGEMAIKQDAEDEGIALANINHFRSFIDQIVTYVVAQRPAWDSRALNNDFKSRSQAILFNALLDAYMEVGGIENDIRRAATHALVLSSGFGYVCWNPCKGNPIRPDLNGNLIYEGDLDFQTPTIFDVVWDYCISDFEECPWVQVRTIKNKWDLVKLYPKKEEEIIESPTYGMQGSSNDYDSYGEIGLRNDLSDQIEVWEFWHKPTPAIPYGRHLSYIADKYPLTSNDNEIEPNEYGIIPLARLVHSEFILTGLGYTTAFDLQVPQEWFGLNLSTILTDLNTLGQPKYIIHPDDDLSAEDFEPGNGVPFIKALHPVNLLDPKSHVKDLSEGLEHSKLEMGLMAGIGPVSRGTPEGELKGASGAALALLDSKSIQSVSIFNARYRDFVAKWGTIILKILQKKATTTRVVALAGIENRSKLTEWSAEDISQVDRVVVETGSPLQRSISGKVQIADALRDQGWVSTPQEYLTVIETGQFKPMVSSIESQLNCIADENQRLRENYEQAEQALNDLQMAMSIGNMDMVAMIEQYLQAIGVVCLDKVDNHILHYRRHSSLLDSSEIRMMKGIVVPVTAHMQKHLDALMNPEIQRQQLLLGYIYGQQLQEFLASIQIPTMGGGIGTGGPMPAPQKGSVPGAMNPNQPPPETPLPMVETGVAPKPPKIPRQAVKEAIQGNLQ